MKPRLSQRIQFSLAYVLVAAVVLLMLQSWLLAPRTVELSMSKFLELLRDHVAEPERIDLVFHEFDSASAIEVIRGVEAVTTDVSTDARAPLVMVVNLGGVRPYHWIEELDWKAYAVVLRLHAIDHLNQAKKVGAGLRAAEQP